MLKNCWFRLTHQLFLLNIIEDGVSSLLLSLSFKSFVRLSHLLSDCHLALIWEALNTSGENSLNKSNLLKCPNKNPHSAWTTSKWSCLTLHSSWPGSSQIWREILKFNTILWIEVIQSLSKQMKTIFVWNSSHKCMIGQSYKKCSSTYQG